ncbi:hypothetical protein [Novosphingobium terrae]|uniref:hypothetical protein n=1 Tax=Novosphingobium terrae TaxID=2726189 RepID=UPI00198101A2|nr:hypothetical protein [Novosphingobium terrae]
MQILGILIALLAIGIAIPFSGGGYTPSRIVSFDYQAELNVSLIEAFSRAAWAAGRTMGQGPIDRSSMALPSGFADDPNRPFQAWSDGSYIYVWSASNDPTLLKPSAPFPGLQASDVQVGIAGPSSIQWRDGSSAPKPANIPDNCLVIRMHY